MKLFEKTYPDMPAAVTGIREWATDVANLSRGAAVVDSADPENVTVQIGRRTHWLRHSPREVRPYFAKPAPNGDLLVVVHEGDNIAAMSLSELSQTLDGMIKEQQHGR